MLNDGSRWYSALREALNLAVETMDIVPDNPVAIVLDDTPRDEDGLSRSRASVLTRDDMERDFAGDAHHELRPRSVTSTAGRSLRLGEPDRVGTGRESQLAGRVVHGSPHRLGDVGLLGEQVLACEGVHGLFRPRCVGRRDQLVQ